jgi:hypothetical protein
VDAGQRDAGPDAREPLDGAPDDDAATIADASPADSAPPDRVNAGGGDAAEAMTDNVMSGGGCDCRAARYGSSDRALAISVVSLLVWKRRRRRELQPSARKRHA